MFSHAGNGVSSFALTLCFIGAVGERLWVQLTRHACFVVVVLFCFSLFRDVPNSMLVVRSGVGTVVWERCQKGDKQGRQQRQPFGMGGPESLLR